MNPIELVTLYPGGLQLSELVYGAWRLFDDPQISDRNYLTRKIESLIDLGYTSFDHADIYGNYQIEFIFGQVLKSRPDLRQKIQLISKAGIKLVSAHRPENTIKHYDTSATHLKTSVENSLKQLHTDCLDLFLIHRPDPFMNFAETADALDELVRSGKVRFVGVSNFSPWQFDTLQTFMKQRLVTNQIEISPLHGQPFLDGTLDHCQKSGIKPMAWSPLGGGRLFEEGPTSLRVRRVMAKLAEQKSASLAQIAIAWLRLHPAGIIPVVGSSQMQRLMELCDSKRVSISREEWFQIWTAYLGQDVP